MPALGDQVAIGGGRGHGLAAPGLGIEDPGAAGAAPGRILRGGHGGELKGDVAAEEGDFTAGAVQATAKRIALKQDVGLVIAQGQEGSDA